jgi:hypothetical protein
MIVGVVFYRVVLKMWSFYPKPLNSFGGWWMKDENEIDYLTVELRK